LPNLSVGTASCSADLLTYSVSFTSKGVATSTTGTVEKDLPNCQYS
jgi:hypothetical protein